jgi:hypothetical protein
MHLQPKSAPCNPTSQPSKPRTHVLPGTFNPETLFCTGKDDFLNPKSQNPHPKNQTKKSETRNTKTKCKLRFRSNYGNNPPVYGSGAGNGTNGTNTSYIE